MTSGRCRSTRLRNLLVEVSCFNIVLTTDATVGWYPRLSRATSFPVFRTGWLAPFRYIENMMFSYASATSPSMQVIDNMITSNVRDFQFIGPGDHAMSMDTNAVFKAMDPHKRHRKITFQTRCAANLRFPMGCREMTSGVMELLCS